MRKFIHWPENIGESVDQISRENARERRERRKGRNEGVLGKERRNGEWEFERRNAGVPL